MFMEQTFVKAFGTGGADELLDGKLCKISECQDFKQDLIGHLIKSSSFIVPVNRFVKQQSKKPSVVKRSLDKRTFKK